jgi:Arc/MetJ family transcription regulator
MPCAERDKLIRLLKEARTAYGDALRTTIGPDGEVLERTGKLAEGARTTYEDCREVLVSHERSHGCADETVGASGS